MSSVIQCWPTINERIAHESVKNNQITYTTKAVKNDESARPPNVTLASCTLTFDLLTIKFDNFIPLHQ